MPKLVPNRGKLSKDEFINGAEENNNNEPNNLSLDEKRIMAPRGQLIHTYNDDEKVARTYRIRKKYIMAIAEKARNDTDIRARKKVTETDVLDQIFKEYFKI